MLATGRRITASKVVSQSTTTKIRTKNTARSHTLDFSRTSAPRWTARRASAARKSHTSLAISVETPEAPRGGRSDRSHTVAQRGESDTDSCDRARCRGVRGRGGGGSARRGPGAGQTSCSMAPPLLACAFMHGFISGRSRALDWSEGREGTSRRALVRRSGSANPPSSLGAPVRRRGVRHAAKFGW